MRKSSLPAFSRSINWEHQPKWVKKGFDRVGRVALPHKRKSYDIFRKLFHHSTSFLSGKGVLIHLYINSSSERAIAAIVMQGSSFEPTISLSCISDLFDMILY